VTEIIGSILVRNEDVFVERAIRNVASFCDRIYVHDHVSSDGTWTIVQRLSSELEHLEAHRSRRTSDSQKPLERYAGTRTWVLGVDGDELFDPAALTRLRAALMAGEHDDVFRLKAHVLNCDGLDRERGTASGYMAPPSRPITKLFNFAAVSSWTGSSHRLHDGRPVFRSGFHWDSMRYLSETLAWDEDPLRCLHVCFLPRSTRDTGEAERLNPVETASYDRTLVGRLKRLLRAPAIDPKTVELHRSGTTWKREWYARGERVTLDASPFLGG
jgi:hypothetical protein